MAVSEMHMHIITKDGAKLRVGPDGDGLGLIAVEGGDYFGRLVLTAEAAVALAPALVAVAVHVAGVSHG